MDVHVLPEVITDSTDESHNPLRKFGNHKEQYDHDQHHGGPVVLAALVVVARGAVGRAEQSGATLPRLLHGRDEQAAQERQQDARQDLDDHPVKPFGKLSVLRVLESEVAIHYNVAVREVGVGIVVHHLIHDIVGDAYDDGAHHHNANRELSSV